MFYVVNEFPFGETFFLQHGYQFFDIPQNLTSNISALQILPEQIIS